MTALRSLAAAVEPALPSLLFVTSLALLLARRWRRSSDTSPGSMPTATWRAPRASLRGERLNRFTERRPFNSPWLALRLRHGGLSGALWIQALLLGLAAFGLAHTLGVRAGLAAGLSSFALLYGLTRDYVGAVVAEPLGASFACLGLAVMLACARRPCNARGSEACAPRVETAHLGPDHSSSRPGSRCPPAPDYSPLATPITAQARRPPALPVGCVLRSSGLAWTMTPRPRIEASPSKLAMAST